MFRMHISKGTEDIPVMGTDVVVLPIAMTSKMDDFCNVAAIFCSLCALPAIAAHTISTHIDPECS